MKRSYLEHIKIVSFGAFSNKAVGPFAPHLNVVSVSYTHLTLPTILLV